MLAGDELLPALAFHSLPSKPRPLLQKSQTQESTQGEADEQRSLRAVSAQPMAHLGAGAWAAGQEPAQKDAGA